MKKIVFCLVVFLIAALGTAYAEVLIIANNNVSETVLSQSDVYEIFLGKRVKWGDNSAIKPVTLKIPDIHKAFLLKYIKRTRSQWKNYWRKMLFTGQAMPPKEFKTPEELVEYVANTHGAVGYIDINTLHDDVKSLTIQ